MAISVDLRVFVRDALEHGVSRAEIAEALTGAGWPREQVQGALSSFAEVEFPVPVPRPKPSLSAREAFVYLVLFSTLYVSAFNLGRLVFLFINQAFPDPATPEIALAVIREGIRFSVSSLIVAFPVFLYVSRLTAREVRRDPTQHASPVRRWLTYLTLFVAAGLLIGDFTSLVYSFLGGELTIRFVLKVLTICIIAGAAFGYYLWDLRLEEREAVS